jgi:hypothetical protein
MQEANHATLTTSKWTDFTNSRKSLEIQGLPLFTADCEILGTPAQLMLMSRPLVGEPMSA